jgi:hypothetical protein
VLGKEKRFTHSAEGGREGTEKRKGKEAEKPKSAGKSACATGKVAATRAGS